MFELFIAISLVVLIPSGLLYYKKSKSIKNESTIEDDFSEESYYFIKHSCGKKTPISKRFIIGNTFACIHCQKKVTPRQLRCMRCTALIDLKSITPLFHSPIRCKACKLCFELPTKNANVL
ncbi:MAG: hypothetical protein KC646_11455 [Candidatus Cloacimonetes bacterium]|nr:hypothetical protein [Candidatus Cloacimonadota bacterium]